MALPPGTGKSDFFHEQEKLRVYYEELADRAFAEGGWAVDDEYHIMAILESKADAIQRGSGGELQVLPPTVTIIEGRSGEKVMFYRMPEREGGP